MAWNTVRIGKHKGSTLPQVVWRDPDYFFWAIEDSMFRSGSLRVQAADIYQRATHIKIPRQDHVAIYLVDPTSSKFTKLLLEPRSRRGHEEHVSGNVIDLSVPRSLSSYDKTGSRLLIKDVKRILFGSSTRRMTKERCEKFFEDDDNFEL
jgi:hypothetical protein